MTKTDEKSEAMMSKKAEDHCIQTKQVAEQGNITLAKELNAKAQKIEQNLRLFDGITSALYAPNSNGIMGDITRAASPELAHQIGQYFKENKALNQLDNGNRPEEQSPQHLLAHAILGTAVSYITGNNSTTGALSAVSSEVAAPALANYLYGTKDPSELSQEQKDTITNIITLATASTAYAFTDGDVANSMSASEVGKAAVENNDHDRLLPNGTSYHPGDRVRFSDEEALFIKDAIGFVVTPIGFLDAYHNAKTNEDKALAVATAFKIPIGKARTYVQKAKTKQNTRIGHEPDVGNQASKGLKDINKTGQATKPTTMKNKTTCSGVNVCFTAGTLIHTTDGLKPIETITHGDLIWSRQEFGDEYDHRPVIATKATPNQEVYEVVVKHSNNTTETFKTTSEHPFWVNGIGWLKASLLEQGMTLLDRHGNPNITIVSQSKLEHTETVYNFEVQDFHTYHIGEYGVWVHNAECCGVALSTLESYVEKSARGTGKLHRVNENELTQLILDIGYNKDELLKAKSILEHSIKIRKAEKVSQPGGRLDAGHQKRVDMEYSIKSTIC